MPVETRELSGAVLSPCERYRYALWRELPGRLDMRLAGVRPTVLFVMLNPSTADASVDDPTIRRCKGFAESWGYSRLAVANLYALRATNPRALDGADDPVGPECDDWIVRLAEDADRIVVAWGANTGPIADRAQRVLHELGYVDALGLTASGQPRHPLYVPADRELVAFDA